MTTYLFSKWTARHIATGQIKRRLAVTGPEKIVSIGTRALFYPLITQIDVIGTTIGIQYAAGIIFSETIPAGIVSVFQICGGVAIYFGGTFISFCVIIVWIVRDYCNNNLRVWSFNRRRN